MILGFIIVGLMCFGFGIIVLKNKKYYIDDDFSLKDKVNSEQYKLSNKINPNSNYGLIAMAKIFFVFGIIIVIVTVIGIFL